MKNTTSICSASVSAQDKVFDGSVSVAVTGGGLSHAFSKKNVGAPVSADIFSVKNESSTALADVFSVKNVGAAKSVSFRSKTPPQDKVYDGGSATSHQ